MRRSVLAYDRNAVDPPLRNVVFMSCSCEARIAKRSSDTNTMSRLLNF
jgi:hypothetical protein